MELSAAQTAGLLLIYFDKDPLGLIDHRFRVGAVEGKAEITVAVHGRHGDAESVVLVFGTDMAGYIPVVCGEKIGIAAVYRLACTAGGKPGIAGHLAREGIVGVEFKGIDVQQGLHLNALYVTVSHLVGDGAHDCGGLGRTGVHTEKPAGLYLLGKRLRGDKLLCV